MLTVGSLVSDCGLELVAGAEAADRDVRWVHISELEDPTPWLSGGEVLLTTGISLPTAAKQRRLISLLASGDAAGIGFGTGFDHDKLPKALVDEARKRSLPLFEVPYEMPFIAITERAATRLINEQYDVLERSSAVHERLERLVVEDRGLDEVLASIAAAVSGTALVHDQAGRELARHADGDQPPAAVADDLARELGERRDGAASVAFVPEHPELADRALSVPVPGGRAPVGWLTVAAERAPLGEFERLCARQAAIVVGLELMRQRIVRETERRLAGDLLADALGGRLDSDELTGRLRPFGISAEAAVLVYQLADPTAAEGTLEAALADAGVTALVATSSAAGRPLLCAVVDAGAGDPVELARTGRDAIAAADPEVRAAASRPFRVGSLRRAFHEARCALEATSVADGDAPEVASHADVGAFTLLLSLQDDDALRLYSDGLLDPIERTEGEYGGELLRSLEAFIDNNGNWERAARQLYCHRHTLRYRIRKIEELTGRDLGRATDRIELWLAMRARELVR
ncbi:MAG TPA: PucR family transcriptional regulator [Solirubrobacterales bacterium]|nr:PucR family transcriptional regulator [Solirubrobacterales bacterium]